MDYTQRFPWWRRDASLIAVLVAMAAVAFTGTYFFTKSYQRRQDSLAREWFRRGETSLTNGHPKEAVEELRTALRYSDTPKYRLKLAQALATDGNDQTDQAIAYFLNLWEEQPGNGLYNLELARLYARKNTTRLATQYYNGAIYGAWDENPAEQRREARMEYIQFLLNNNSPTQAQAEAITLAAGVPPHDIPGRFQAADVLMKTGEYERALEEYASLTRNDPARAALGAGNAAFQLGRFRSAAKYLNTAVDRGTQDSRAATRLEQAKSVVEADPAQRGASAAERARRVSEAYIVAGRRLQQCAEAQKQQLEITNPTTDLQKLYAEWASAGLKASPAKLARDPDARDDIMELVYRIEETTSRMCGQPSGTDWALLMLSRYGDGVLR